MIEIIYTFIALGAVMLNFFAQISLKIFTTSKESKNRFKKKSFFFWLILAIFLFILCSIASIIAQKKIELNDFNAIAALSYILVPIGSVLLLKENLNKKQILSIGIIFLGIIIFNY